MHYGVSESCGEEGEKFSPFNCRIFGLTRSATNLLQTNMFGVGRYLAGYLTKIDSKTSVHFSGTGKKLAADVLNAGLNTKMSSNKKAKSLDDKKMQCRNKMSALSAHKVPLTEAISTC